MYNDLRKKLKDNKEILKKDNEEERVLDILDKNTVSIRYSAFEEKHNVFINLEDELKTFRVCEKAIEISPYNIEFIPYDKLTDKECHKLCEKAVKLDKPKNDVKTILQSIPEKYITEEICKIAVKRDFQAINYIPDKFLTKDFCEFALKNNEFISLLDIPREHRTKELCEIAIDNRGCNIHHVPEEFIDTRLCIKAINNESGLLLIPRKFRNWDVCYKAVKKNGLNLEEVPREIKKDELICKTAVLQNKDAISFVDENIKDKVLREVNSSKINKGVKKENTKNLNEKLQKTKRIEHKVMENKKIEISKNNLLR